MKLMSKQSPLAKISRALLLAISGCLIMGTVPAAALSGSDWSAGRIIDDGIFYDASTMNGGDIQEFLNSKVPVCDTNGDQGYAGTTRRAYSQARGYNPPYTCLKDYRQDVPGKSAETGLCNAISGSSNRTAADIIAIVGSACSINPRVLLVLLQKEQSLVTDDWPWSIQYRSATGYGCPDTAACDSTYYGFFNQVYMAARQFKRYRRDAGLFNYRSGQTSYIAYNPSSSCGGSNVYIENDATAALYNYTPYQPNASALANLYGTGDSCGAYGNRNFWRLFNDWFITTLQTPVGDNVYRMIKPGPNDHYFTGRESDRTIAKTQGYRDDGQRFRSAGQNDAGALPVYSLYNGKISDNFFTLDGPDRYWAIVFGGYREMGVAFYAYATQQAGSVPVHQMWHGGRGDHFYTTQGPDIYFCLNYDGYIYNKVAFYVPE